jgi:nitrate/TMAO reductase-like tetraheme cytochrome c subunit
MRDKIAYLGIAALSIVIVTGMVGYGATRTARGLEGRLASAAAVATPIELMEFPDGTATPSELCGSCHQAIYKEFSTGFGSDLRWNDMRNYPPTEPATALLEGVAKGMSRSGTAHFLAGNDPWTLDARNIEEQGKQCNVCHFPQPFDYPDLNAARIERPVPRSDNREAGITCASCHLTPDGKIRGPYSVDAPHASVKDERISTSVACALCHSDGERVVGKQTQTFLEWRDDFHNAGLGAQQCQDCHMPRTTRKLAEDFDTPQRVVGRHLLSGGHSFQRIASAVTLTLNRPDASTPNVAFYITNVGAGHSVPTGSNRRAIYLIADIVDANARVIATRDWLFAPSFGSRPDDMAFIEDDKRGPQPIASSQADAQGPHESIIRAGEQRVLTWAPKIPEGRYTLRARIVYDLNRYNDRAFKDDQWEIAQDSIEIVVAGARALEAR